MKNPVRKFLKIIDTIINISVITLFGLIYKMISLLSPKIAKRFKGFIRLFVRTNGSLKKSFYVILVPALSILFVANYTILVSANNAKDDKVVTVTKQKEIGERVAKTKVESVKEKQEKVLLDEVSADNASKKTKDDIVVPNDYRGEFITKMLDYSIKVGNEYGIFPSVIMAQAIIESDWGRSQLSVEANNYFGIKAATNSDGSLAQKAVNMPTLEYYEGNTPTQINAYFAKYDSAYGSLEHNAKLLRNGIEGSPKFYSGAWREVAGDYKTAAHSLTKKYATAPDYGDILIQVIQTYGLNFAD